MWHKLINPYSTISKSRQGLIYYGTIVKHCADDYIDAIQAIEKDIDQQHVVDQIEIAYQLKELSENIESVLSKIKEHPIVKELKTDTEG
jgi:cell fate (sporulation/competence/biofilm development) regulator YmcA (YheA/YmcA/DUF963 family)